ncbi:hypothetical protein E2320_006546, partial [Naja naja]
MGGSPEIGMTPQG